MPPFRCASGHEAELVFGDEHLRLPCPKCGVDVYKYRDAVIEEDAAMAAVVNDHPAPGQGLFALASRHVRTGVAGLVFVVAVAWLAWHRPTRPAPASSQGSVIPIDIPPMPSPLNPAPVSITHFSATPTDAGAVKVSLRLTNAGAASNGYPGLAVHWHGVPDGDQLIRKDSYAHPPLPFTATDVTLELARPQGATGIDVTIRY